MPLLEPVEAIEIGLVSFSGRVAPATAARAIVKALELAGYKIVPLDETESRECQSGRRI